MGGESKDKNQLQSTQGQNCFQTKTDLKTKFKNDAGQLQNLMKMVTGEMGSALTLMEQAKNEGAEDC